MLWINFNQTVEKIRDLILDTLFPIKCLGCGIEGVWICDACNKKIKIHDQQKCPFCEKIITPDGQTCFSCKHKSDLNGLLVATSYQDPLVSKAVHLFKYRFIEKLSEPLSDVIIKATKSYELPLPELIIPIPLHPKRLRWRGFNQSGLLAKKISMNLLAESELEISEDALSRKNYTRPQKNIESHHDRKLNVQGAFIVKKSHLIKNKRILLVDDIATTGSTIFECASVLKNAGAREVYAVVIARQEYEK